MQCGSIVYPGSHIGESAQVEGGQANVESGVGESLLLIGDDAAQIRSLAVSPLFYPGQHEEGVCVQGCLGVVGRGCCAFRGNGPGYGALV